MTSLLTQDYRASRDELLAWVQAESSHTNEPLVIGLVPEELRDRWAVFTVTDEATGPVVPAAADWNRLAVLQGRTTVEVQRVTQPLAWSSAVSAGRITDPGITGREVTALVTRHTIEAGTPRQSVTSVAVTLNLEGPPTRPDWRFVGVVTYDAIPVSSP